MGGGCEVDFHLNLISSMAGILPAIKDVQTACILCLLHRNNRQGQFCYRLQGGRDLPVVLAEDPSLS